MINLVKTLLVPDVTGTPGGFRWTGWMLFIAWWAVTIITIAAILVLAADGPAGDVSRLAPLHNAARQLLDMVLWMYSILHLAAALLFLAVWCYVRSQIS